MPNGHLAARGGGWGVGPADPWGDGERVHRAQALAQTGLRLHRAGTMWEPERRPTLMTQG